jgi:hypothetical protein
VEENEALRVLDYVRTALRLPHGGAGSPRCPYAGPPQLRVVND